MPRLSARLDSIARERLARLRLLSYEQLAAVEQAEVTLKHGWWCRGSVWTEVTQVAPNTLRAAVFQTAVCHLWSGYYHAFDGFRIRQDGTHLPLTSEDAYDLD